MRNNHRTIPELDEEKIRWFWSMVEHSLSGNFDICWPWLGEIKQPYKDPRYKNSKRSDPYGQCALPGGLHQAHRVAYFIWTGTQPGKLLVLHSCNNMICCNPTHLRAGTTQDNTDDMIAAGRDNFWGHRNQA